MKKTFAITLGVLVALTLLLSPAGLMLVGQAARPLADFNRDRAADLVLGVPDEDQGAATNMGAFQVLYGSSSGGLQGGSNDVWGQFSNSAESGDFFAYSLAAGDFDGDGHDDLAVGIPWEDLEGTTTITNAGAVEVWYGGASGLDSGSAEFWHQDVGSIQSLAEQGDLFGYALAVGDFDADGYDDLAVGLPYETWNQSNCGIVQIIYGSSGGLTDAGNQLFRQGAGQITEPEESGDHFGKALAVGDFDGDGYDDLAIGAPDENFESPSALTDAGLVHILYGSTNGLSTLGWQTSSLATPAGYDYFGQALTSGDFDGNGYADLAVGTPGRDLTGPVLDGGLVAVIFSDSGGFGADVELWQQANPEHFDEFGSALSAGDYNGDWLDDLVIGVPEEDLGTVADAGVLEILYGATSGLVRRVGFNDLWHQDRSGMEDTAETGDGFGYALASGDFDGDGYADLVAGIPYEDVGGADGAGAAQVLYGSANGINASGNWFFHQGLAAIEGQAASGDHFGKALVAIPRTVCRLFLPLVLRNAP